ncbi:MAG TPA: hypothetical protein VNW06_13045 [Cytophagaceae bacterium]|nr:hypothetical protein [Cytophagaceae bacterium]
MLIGIHQAMTVSYGASYWLFMLALAALMWYQLRKKSQKKAQDEKEVTKETKASGSSLKKRKYKM